MWKKGRMPSVRQVSSICACASTWRVTATRLRCVSITPFGRPEVPLEYGSTARSFRGSMVTAGGSPSLSRSAAKGVAPAFSGGVSPNTKISRTDVPRAASRTLSRNSGIVDQIFRAGVAELDAELLGRIQRIGRRHDAADHERAVERQRILGQVRAADGHHVALGEATARETGRHPPRAASDLSLRERSPAGAVDEDGPIGAIARVPENEARVRHVGDRNVRVRAAKDHGRAYPIRHDTRTRSRAGQAEDTRGAGVRAANHRAG